jgi:hypothetical protein
MKKQRRDIQIFSLSFLDCICCGFGAVILLFVLSKFAEPLIIEEVKDDLEAKIIRLEEELVEIRGETVIINRELTAQKEQLSKEKIRLARLQGDLSKIEGRFAASKDTAQVQNIIEGRLARAMQQLTEEYYRYIGQHAAQRLGSGTEKTKRNPGRISEGQGHPDNERYGRIYVFSIPRKMDSRYTGAAPGYYFQAERLAGLQQ